MSNMMCPHKERRHTGGRVTTEAETGGGHLESRAASPPAATRTDGRPQSLAGAQPVTP